MDDQLSSVSPEEQARIKRDVTRRRFIAWTGVGVAATAVAGMSLAHMLDNDTDDVDRSAGGQDNGFELRHLNFALPFLSRLGTKKNPVQYSLWVAGQELPIAAHTNDTWSRFTGENPIGHRLNRDLVSHYLAAPDGSSVYGLQMPKGRAALGIIYATLPSGKEVPVSTMFLAPATAQRKVVSAAAQAKANISKLFAGSAELQRLKLSGSNGQITSVDEAVGFGDVVDANSASAAALVYCAPWIRTIDPTAAAITLNLIANGGAMAGLIKAVEAFPKKIRAPYGVLEDMIKKVSNGKVVPQTLDPRLDTNYKTPPGEQPVTVDPDIGELPAKSFTPFLQMGMKWQGKEVPRDLIFNFKSALSASLVEINNAVQDTPDLGAVIDADTDLNKLTGKTWTVMPANVPAPTTVSTVSKASIGGLLAKYRGANSAKVNFSVLQGEKKSKSGLYVQLQNTTENSDGSTELKLRVWNNLDRTITFGVQFFDGRDLPIQPPDGQRLSSNKLDPTWKIGCPLLEGVPIIMGIPAGIDSNYLDLHITLPAQATRARVIAGTLGTGNEWRELFKSVEVDSKGTEILGPDGKPKLVSAYVDSSDKKYIRPDWYQDAVFVTSAINIGMPGLMFLSQAIAINRFRNSLNMTTNDYTWIKHDDGELELKYATTEDISNRRKSGFKTIYMLDTILGTIEGVLKNTTASTSDILASSLFALGKVVLDFLTYKFIYKAMTLYLEALTEATIQKAIPIYGQIYVVTAIGTATSEIAQASAAVAQNDTVYWDVAATYDTSLVAKPQFESGFSKSAACWKIDVLLDGQTEGKQYLPKGYEEKVVEVDGDKYYEYAVIPEFQQPRVDPLIIPLPKVPFGGKIQYVITILSQDGWTVGSAATDWLDNSNLNAIPDKIEVTVREDAVELGGKSRYERRWTTAVQSGKYVMATEASVPGTIHDTDVTLGSVMYGHGTGLMGYVYKTGGRWFVRQLNSSEQPGTSAAELASSYTGNPPIVLTDPLQNRVNGIADAWLLEPVEAKEDEQDGYHVRKLSLANNSITFDAKKVYGHIPTRVHAASLAPGGLITGINTDTATFSILRPALASHNVDAGSAPLAALYGGPGNKLGDRPGLLDKPVGLAVAANGVIVILEQGAKRLSAFNLLGAPVKAFAQEKKDDQTFYATTDEGVTFLDIGSDGDGYVFVLGYRNAGLSIDDYVLDVYAPQSETRLFRVNKVNSGRMAVDWFRDVYSLNFQSIKALAGKAADQPSVSIWVPRTPHPVSP